MFNKRNDEKLRVLTYFSCVDSFFPPLYIQFPVLSFHVLFASTNSRSRDILLQLSKIKISEDIPQNNESHEMMIDLLVISGIFVKFAVLLPIAPNTIV